MEQRMSTSTTTTDNDADDVDRVPYPHPGEILQEEFLAPFGVTQYRLSKDTGISESHVSKIVRGTAGITANTAVRLARYFGNSAEFWLGLQDAHDLAEARSSVDVAAIPQLRISYG
jgi:addiction module HigA family antidote